MITISGGMIDEARAYFREKFGREVKKENVTLLYKADGYYDRVLGGEKLI